MTAEQIVAYNAKNASNSLITAKTFLSQDNEKQNEILSNAVSGKNENYASISISVNSFEECDKIKSVCAQKTFKYEDREISPNFRLFDNGSFAISFFIGIRKTVSLSVTDK